ncbi:hypothetical protein G127AT_03320 [Agromyces archimandritae]|uniref:Uncharacterized protein n=1 Tax=Agromyces archimandritae TaxID=2781962 RepID=A0A975IP46_9MICO|nr:hypothetical protein G127AT_03320 [Agromyces archimandritae]
MLIVTIVLAVLLGAVRWMTRGHAAPARTPAGRWAWVWAVAVVVAALLIGIRSVQIVGEPGAISQTFDNIFHLNAVRYILDTGSASPLEVGKLTSANLWFYPVGWHEVVTLALQLTGVAIPVAINATWIAFSIVAWPLGALLLARTLAGSTPAVAIGAGVVAAAIPAFPILMVDYGVLYPYHAALALTPAAVAATVAVFRLGREGDGLPLGWSIVAMLGTLPALALTHPGAFVTWLALTLPVAAIALIRFARRSSGRPCAWTIVAFVGYLAVGFVALRVLRPPLEATLWPPIGTTGHAVGDVITVSPYGAKIALVVMVLMIGGIVVAARKRRPADAVALSMFAVAALLYIIVAGVSSATVRQWVTASWYNNTPRLAAVLPMVIVPLAALAVGAAWAWFMRRGFAERRLQGAAGVVVAVVAVAVLAASTQLGRAMTAAVDHAHAGYRATENAALVSPDELELLEELPEFVPEGVAIAGSPWTGAGLAYAIADRPVLMPHTLMDVDEATETINESLATGDDAALCAAIEERNVGFVLDFGDREVHGGDHDYAGLDELANSDAVVLVHAVGDARLYEIVACEAP